MRPSARSRSASTRCGLQGKFGENPEYTGRILAVGIAYHKDDAKKRHECKVEVLRERI